MIGDPSERRAYLCFHLLPMLGPKRLRALLDRFGSARLAWEAGPSGWIGAHALSASEAESLRPAWRKVDPQRAEMAASDAGLSLWTPADPEYPPHLREIYDMPAALYGRGTLLPEDRCSIAVVGSRRATAYGRKVARLFAGGLAAAGLTVISGLAKGIDGEAHRAALDAGGRTVAVLGCGADRVYPKENEELYRRIPTQGALLSEYLPGTPPLAGHFVPRNRIIAGLSLGVLVVEAADQSGALRTADFAGQYGRHLFGVPGDVVRETSAGPHKLIRQGGILVRHPDDILDDLRNVFEGFGWKPPAHLLAEGGTGFEGGSLEARLCAVLNTGPRHVDELIRASRRSAAEVRVALLHLELSGRIKRLPGDTFCLGRGRATYRKGTTAVEG